MTRRGRIWGAIVIALFIIAISSIGLVSARTSSPHSASGANPLLSATWMEGEVSGRVMSTHRAGSYPYLRVDTEDGELWAVIAEPLPRSHQEVTRLRLYASLERYTSRRLGQTFENLHFATLIDSKEP